MAQRNSIPKFCKSVAIIALVSACSTAKEIQGEALFKEIPPLQNTEYYQGGPTSLPAARQFAQERAQAMLDASNRESQARNAASTTVLGTGLAALGLSLNGAGSQELFSILGLSSGAALYGSQLYINRERQSFLDDGAKAMVCLIQATDPYFIKEDKWEKLFGGEVPAFNAVRPNLFQTNQVRVLLKSGVSNDALEKVLDTEITVNDDTEGLQGRLRKAIVDFESARALAVANPPRSGTNKASYDKTISDAEDMSDLATKTADDLTIFRANVEISGAALTSRVRELILYMSKELRRLEPDPSSAASVFASIKSNLNGVLEGFSAGSITEALSSLTGQEPDENQASASKKAQEILRASMNELRIVLSEVAIELKAIEQQSKVSGASEDCKNPLAEDNLTVLPATALHTLKAGEKITLRINVGNGAKPDITKIKNPSDALKTISGPTPVQGIAGAYTVEITAKDNPTENLTAVILISSDKTQRSVRKTIKVKKKEAAAPVAPARTTSTGTSTPAPAFTPLGAETVVGLVKTIQAFLQTKHPVEGEAPLDMQGKFDKATSDRLKVFQKSQSLLETGRLGVDTSATMNALAKSIVQANDTVAQQQWETNKPKAKKALVLLAKVFGSIATTADNDTFSQEERMVVWNWQYGEHKKKTKASETFQVNGILDSGTIAAILAIPTEGK